MTNISSRPTIEHAATAAEAVRELTHLTLGRRALSEPAELDLLVEELAIMAGDDAHPSSPELLIENPHLVASSTLAGGRP
jgi:hypothetical protein